MSRKKTFTVELNCKEPDQFQDLIHELGLTEAQRNKYFDCGEYATIEIEIDKSMRVVSGRILPV